MASSSSSSSFSPLSSGIHPSSSSSSPGSPSFSHSHLHLDLFVSSHPSAMPPPLSTRSVTVATGASLPVTLSSTSSSSGTTSLRSEMALQLENLSKDLSANWKHYFPTDLAAVTFEHIRSLTPNQIVKLCLLNICAIFLQHTRYDLKQLLTTLKLDFLQIDQLLTNEVIRKNFCTRAKILLKTLEPAIKISSHFDQVIELALRVNKLDPRSQELPLVAEAALTVKAEQTIFRILNAILPKWKKYIDSSITVSSSYCSTITTTMLSIETDQKRLASDPGRLMGLSSCLSLRDEVVKIVKKAFSQIHQHHNLCHRRDPTTEGFARVNPASLARRVEDIKIFIRNVKLMQTFWYGVVPEAGSGAEKHLDDFCKQQTSILKAFFQSLAENSTFGMSQELLGRDPTLPKTIGCEQFIRIIEHMILPVCQSARDHFIRTSSTGLEEEPPPPADLWEKYSASLDTSTFSSNLKTYLQAMQRHYYSCSWRLHKQTFQLAYRFSENFMVSSESRLHYTKVIFATYVHDIIVRIMSKNAESMAATMSGPLISKVAVLAMVASLSNIVWKTIDKRQMWSLMTPAKSFEDLIKSAYDKYSNLTPWKLRDLFNDKTTLFETDTYLLSELQTLHSSLSLYEQFLKFISLKADRRAISVEEIEASEKAYESFLRELDEAELSEPEEEIESKEKDEAVSSMRLVPSKAIEPPPVPSKKKVHAAPSDLSAFDKMSFAVSQLRQCCWQVGGINAPTDLVKLTDKRSYLLADHLISLERARAVAIKMWQSRYSGTLSLLDRKMNVLGHQVLDNLLAIVLKKAKPKTSLKHDTSYLWLECGLTPETSPQLRFWIVDNRFESVAARYRGRYPKTGIEKTASRSTGVLKFLSLVTLTTKIWERHGSSKQREQLKAIQILIDTTHLMCGGPKKEGKRRPGTMQPKRESSTVVVSKASSSSSSSSLSSSAPASISSPHTEREELFPLTDFLFAQVPKEMPEILLHLLTIAKELDSRAPEIHLGFIKKQIVSIQRLAEDFSSMHLTGRDLIEPKDWSILLSNFLFSTHYVAENIAMIVARKHEQVLVRHQLDGAIANGFGRHLSTEAMETLNQIKDISTGDLRPFHLIHKSLSKEISGPIKLLLDLTYYTHHLSEWPTDEGCMDLNGNPLKLTPLQERLQVTIIRLFKLFRELIEKELPAVIA